jgi:hypothetical protein
VGFGPRAAPTTELLERVKGSDEQQCRFIGFSTPIFDINSFTFLSEGFWGDGTGTYLY